MLGLSFYRYSLITGQPEKYIALGNFVDIYKNISVWGNLGRTFLWVFSTVSIETLLGVLLGFLFFGSTNLPGPPHRPDHDLHADDPGAGVHRNLLPIDLRPHVRRIELSDRPGLSVQQIDFLGNRFWAFPMVTLVDVWMWTPFLLLITLAALGAVPKAELEAAEVDRLPWYRRLQYVVWPHAKFILMLGILLRTIDAFKTMDLIYLMTKGGPGNTTETIAITVWRRAFEGFDMGWSSALAVFLLLTAIALTSIYLYVLNVSKQGGSQNAAQ